MMERNKNSITIVIREGGDIGLFIYTLVPNVL